MKGGGCGAPLSKPSCWGSILCASYVAVVGEGGGGSIQVGYGVIVHGLYTRSCNCEERGVVCSLAETEPPGLGFVSGVSNGGRTRWRGVYLSGIQCGCVGFVHAIVQLRGRRCGVQPGRNRATGARFCLGVVKRRCKRVEWSPSESSRVGLRWPLGVVQTFALRRGGLV